VVASVQTGRQLVVHSVSNPRFFAYWWWIELVGVSSQTLAEHLIFTFLPIVSLVRQPRRDA